MRQSPNVSTFVARALAGGALLLTAPFAAQEAAAAGFAIREQSSTAQGMAFAGVAAGGSDISTMFFNPATLMQHPGFQGSANLSLIMPKARFRDGAASTVTATTITGSPNTGDIAEDAVVPAFYVAAPLGEDVMVGVGLTAPFGLVTEHDATWIGRYHGIKSDLKTININPAIAWQVNRRLAIGGGLVAQYVDAELTNAIDFGTAGALLSVPGSVPTQQDGAAKLTGDDWNYGFNLGAVLTPWKGTRIGLAYRSQVNHKLEGEVDYTLDSAGVGAAISGATGRFVDTGASAKLATPASLSFGLLQEVGEGFTLGFEVDWTEWSSFKELRIDLDNPAEPDNVTDEEWKNSFFVSLGGSYQPNEAWTFKAGVAYDSTPIQDGFRTPRIPGSDRVWLALGGDYALADWLSLNAAFTHIRMEDGDVTLTTAGTGNTTRGNLSGRFENSIEIFTLGGRVTF